MHLRSSCLLLLNPCAGEISVGSFSPLLTIRGIEKHLHVCTLMLRTFRKPYVDIYIFLKYHRHAAIFPFSSPGHVCMSD